MRSLKLGSDIVNRFSYSLPKQTQTKPETRGDLAKKEVLSIEKDAINKGWSNDMLWATGAKNYLDITLYEYLAWDGGTVYKVCHDHIIVYTSDEKYAFIYKHRLIKRFEEATNGNS